MILCNLYAKVEILLSVAIDTTCMAAILFKFFFTLAARLVYCYTVKLNNMCDKCDIFKLPPANLIAGGSLNMSHLSHIPFFLCIISTYFFSCTLYNWLN